MKWNKMWKNIPIFLLWMLCHRLKLNSANNPLSCIMVTSLKCKLSDVGPYYDTPENFINTGSPSPRKFPSTPRCHNITATTHNEGIQLVVTWSGPADGSLEFLRGFRLEVFSYEYAMYYVVDLNDKPDLSILQNETFQMKCDYSGRSQQQFRIDIYSLPKDSNPDLSPDACYLNITHVSSEIPKTTYNIERVERSTKQSSFKTSSPERSTENWIAGVIVSLVVGVLFIIVSCFAVWRRNKRSLNMHNENEPEHCRSTNFVQEESLYTSCQSEFDQYLVDPSEINHSESDQSGYGNLVHDQSGTSQFNNDQSESTRSAFDQLKQGRSISDQSEARESMDSIPNKSEFDQPRLDQPISILSKCDQSIAGRRQNQLKSVRFNLGSFDIDKFENDESECDQCIQGQFSMPLCCQCLKDVERCTSLAMSECYSAENSESLLTVDDIKEQLLKLNFPDGTI